MHRMATKRAKYTIIDPLEIVKSKDKLVTQLSDVPWAYSWAEHFEKLANIEKETGDIRHLENGLRNVVSDILGQIEDFKRRSQ